MLTRNPALDSLAAISREYWHVFPRWSRVASPCAMLDPIAHPRVLPSTAQVKAHHTGSVFLTNAHQRARRAHPVARFSSLEPSFTCAGKEAAYARLGRVVARAAAAERETINIAPGCRSKRVNATLQHALARCGIEELCRRNRVCCVNYRVGTLMHMQWSVGHLQSEPKVRLRKRRSDR